MYGEKPALIAPIAYSGRCAFFQAGPEADMASTIGAEIIAWRRRPLIARPI